MDTLTAQASKPTLLHLPNKSLNSHIPTHALTLLLALATLALPILLAYYIHLDYRAFLSLGPGGTPSTPLGYLKIKLLSLISLRDPRRPIAIPPHYRPQTGYLKALPHRSGARPVIRGIAPQRQMSDKSSSKVYESLVQGLRGLACRTENCLLERTSCFEKHSSGLFSRAPITRTCGGEVCHVHPSDGSLHLTLHPSDIRILLESGRGERHPLAKGGWFRRFVPKEFVLVYAARDEGEVETVMEIVRASIWWVSGIDVKVGERLGGEKAGGRGARAEWEGEWQRGQEEVERGEEIRREREERRVCWACRKHLHGAKRVRKDEMVGHA